MPESSKAIGCSDAGGNAEQFVEGSQAFCAVPLDRAVLDPNDINIVLMGEIGVGKTTFVKAFVNSLRCSIIKEGHSYPRMARCCIAGKCIVDDETSAEEELIFGDADNECSIAGASSTQSIRSYRIFLGNRYVRLIDTPGIADTRGIGKDEENLNRFFEVLGELKSVHAFCIVLKSNKVEFTAFFQYCIKQLLFRLGKSVSKNLVFIFTNSRSTFYKLGDGQAAIKEVLKSIKAFSNVNVSFSKKNVFFVDNEGYIFIFESINDNIQSIDIKDIITSWNKSKDASFRMFSYVAALKPHRMQDTISINEATRLILNLCDPLVLIGKNVEDNLGIISRQLDLMIDKNKTIEELKRLLHFEIIKIEVIQLDQPRLICTHGDCIEIYSLKGFKCKNYKQMCKDPCYENVPRMEINDHLELFCRHCDHRYSDHWQVYFDIKSYLYPENYETIGVHRNNEEEVGSKIATRIEVLKKQKESMEKEKATIQKSLSKFAHFLDHNAITLYNHTYGEYIQYLIHKENSYGQNKDENLIRTYEDLLNVYKGQKIDSEAIVVTAEDVIKTIQELYHLERSGKFIWDSYEKQQPVRQHIALLHTEKNLDACRRRGYAVNKRMTLTISIISFVLFIIGLSVDIFSIFS